jgi:2-methylcitrate dehydratase PrpD
MLTERLARFAAETQVAAIPAPAMGAARDALMDTLGVAMAGTQEDVSAIAFDWVREQGARGQSSVWGSNLATSPAEAAFANGISAHALDFDDSIPTLRGHPSASMVAAALAVGESVHASGADVLASYAIGLEIAGKIGRALSDGHYMRGWHTTATVGALSCTTVAGRLWKLDALKMQTAWGLAASQMSGLLRNFGTMTKPFHVGQSARVGVVSAWMAAHGLTADTSIFDGADSVLKIYGGDDGAPLEGLIEKLGNPWELIEPGISVKRWPCCYGTHRPIAGLLALRAEHAIVADEIERIEIGFVPGNDAALADQMPTTGLEAKFSMEYVAAATFVDGKIGLESFNDSMVQRAPVRALMGKVRRYVVDAAEVVSGAPIFVQIAIHTARGTFTTRVDKAPGSSDAPMDAADRLEKFMDCAQRVLSAERAADLHHAIDTCEQLDDLGMLVRATSV